MTPSPNPGSDAALDMGCACPVLDNGHGRGSGPFWVSGDCPLHGNPSPHTDGSVGQQNLSDQGSAGDE